VPEEKKEKEAFLLTSARGGEKKKKEKKTSLSWDSYPRGEEGKRRKGGVHFSFSVQWRKGKKKRSSYFIFFLP